MAIGDIVAVGGAWVSYVPALGVEIVITTIIGTNFGITDGVNEATSTTTGATNDQNTKLMISNAVYYRYFSPTNQGFTGLQIK